MRRLILGASTLGACVVIGSAMAAGTASAQTCTCPAAETAAASSLPFTGFDAADLAVIGVGVVAAGGGLVLAGRRRGMLPMALTIGGVAVAGLAVIAPITGVADAATVPCGCPTPVATSPASGGSGAAVAGTTTTTTATAAPATTVPSLSTSTTPSTVATAPGGAGTTSTTAVATSPGAGPTSTTVAPATTMSTTTTPTTGVTIPGTGSPAPALGEAPVATALPLAGLTLAGAVLAYRRQRSSGRSG